MRQTKFSLGKGRLRYATVILTNTPRQYTRIRTSTTIATKQSIRKSLPLNINVPHLFSANIKKTNVAILANASPPLAINYEICENIKMYFLYGKRISKFL